MEDDVKRNRGVGEDERDGFKRSLKFSGIMRAVDRKGKGAHRTIEVKLNAFEEDTPASGVVVR